MTDARNSARITVRDGLQLHVSCYPSIGAGRGTNVICLPGLTRNGRDFERLALHLSQHAERPRTVYCLDFRGRGRSDRDPDWQNYSVPVEAQDVLDVITATGTHGAAIVGTSRGGIVAMVLSALQPTAIGPVVLNDIGPAIERDGLARIAGYVGRTPVPLTWADAQAMLEQVNRSQFPGVPADEWEAVARQWFNETDGRPAAGYDPAIARSLASQAGPPPQLWAQFTALTRKPLLVLRGELSDILSQATVDEMCRRHPNASATVVPRQGHAPLLRDTASMEAIRRFLDDADDGVRIAGRRY